MAPTRGKSGTGPAFPVEPNKRVASALFSLASNRIAMARKHRAQAVMDDREYRLVQEAARASGQSVSSFLRAAALSAAVETLDEPNESEEEEDGPTDTG